MIANSQQKYHFCTYFDSNYLTRGIALYESLVCSCQKPFTLWVLCFDEETYAILLRLNLANVRLVSLQEFEDGDEELVHTKATRSTVEYYWTCTPSWPLYVLQHNPEVEVITYLDADLFFYGDPQPIYDEFGNGSILIIEHRYAQKYLRYAETTGVYNVGLMAFRRDVNGLACLQWWRERCIEWCYAFVESGKFGDQKYLDDWPERFDNVVVLQHKGAGLAPWNLRRFSVQFGHKVITVDEQSLIFYHFHGYKEIDRQVAVAAGNNYVISLKEINHLYVPYGNALNKIRSLVGLHVKETDNFKNIIAAFAATKQIGPLLLFSLPHPFALGFWWIGSRFHLSQKYMKSASSAYSKGDLNTANAYCLNAVKQNPLLIGNRSIQSMLLESIIGSVQMKYYRQTWHQILVKIRAV